MMQCYGGSHDVLGQFNNERGKLVLRIREMLVQNCMIYCCESIQSGKADCKHVEMSLQTGIDSKAARSRIHTGDILTVVYVLER